MLQINDFKNKKILFVFGNKEVNSLRFSNENIRLYNNTIPINQISLFSIFAIFVIGDLTITTQILRKIKERGISIIFLNRSFKQYAEVMSYSEANYILRSKQYLLPEDSNLSIAKLIIKNKIINQHRVLKQYNKLGFNYKDYITRVDDVTDYKILLGLEGTVARKYFSTLFNELDWNRRAPQTKEDINNLLLDIGYTFLFNYIDALLKLFGFDTYKGVYHKMFFQRKSLSCDLMEPIRPIIDKELYKMYSLGILNENDFKIKNGMYSFKNSEITKKYVNVWFELIVKKKEELYNYIGCYYRYISNPDKYKFKPFEIR